MRTLIVGEAPARLPVGEPLDIPRMWQLCGCTRQEYLEAFERSNLINETAAGVHGVPGGFDIHQISASLEYVAKFWTRGDVRRVVLLGRTVQKAFGLLPGVKLRFFEEQWIFTQARIAIIAPHPSGKSRWWNDADNYRLAQDFWRREFRLSCVRESSNMV